MARTKPALQLTDLSDELGGLPLVLLASCLARTLVFGLGFLSGNKVLLRQLSLSRCKLLCQARDLILQRTENFVVCNSAQSTFC